MKRYFILLMLISHAIVAQSKATTIYLIRHAEKADNSKDTHLSAEGMIRANHWNDVFSAIKFDAIYSTGFNRTKQTVKPTADAQKIDVVLYSPKELTPEKIKSSHQGQTLLIAGHSNTIPELANKLIGQNVYPMMEETTFGDLYIVTINNETAYHQLLKSL